VNANDHIGTGSLEHKGIISPVKKLEFICDRMSCNKTKRSLV
jgi:hypothetical protein